MTQRLGSHSPKRGSFLNRASHASSELWGKRHDQWHLMKAEGLSFLYRADWIRGFQWLLVFGLSVGLLMFFLNMPAILSHYRIEKLEIQVKGQYVTKEKVRQEILPMVVESNFFQIDLEAIKHRIEQIPWVDSTQVIRRWPGNLQIQIVERVPIGVWNEVFVISQTGDLFKPDSYKMPQALPHFIGPDHLAWQVMAFYRQVGKFFSHRNLRIHRLELKKGLWWRIELSDGFVFFVETEAALPKLERFLSYFSRLRQERPTAQYVDLRYEQGFAVGFSKPSQ